MSRGKRGFSLYLVQTVVALTNYQFNNVNTSYYTVLSDNKMGASLTDYYLSPVSVTLIQLNILLLFPGMYYIIYLFSMVPPFYNRTVLELIIIKCIFTTNYCHRYTLFNIYITDNKLMAGVFVNGVITVLLEYIHFC